MAPTVAIVATLDTKGEEVDYLRRMISVDGCKTIVIDVGTLHSPTASPDITREQVVAAAGYDIADLKEQKDRRACIQAVIEGASAVVVELHDRSQLTAVISVGGGTGTHIGMGVMRALPLGVPKLMVSTVASRDMSQLIGTKDITVMHSVTDILGLNPISKRILESAAAAISGMAVKAGPIISEKPIIGLTSFGFITEGATKVKRMLEETGYEVAPFHANGTGGMAMEDLVEQGLIRGVLDFALHEFADQLYGGYCGAIGQERLETAGRLGIPQLIVPGGLDCIVLEFSSLETMPERVKGRKVFWYDYRSGVRTIAQDLITLAETIAAKLNKAVGPTKILIPLRGWSTADAPGGPLYDPVADEIFTSRLKTLLSQDIEVMEVDAHINEPEFAKIVVSEFHSLMLRTG